MLIKLKYDYLVVKFSDVRTDRFEGRAEELCRGSVSVVTAVLSLLCPQILLVRNPCSSGKIRSGEMR